MEWSNELLKGLKAIHYKVCVDQWDVRVIDDGTRTLFDFTAQGFFIVKYMPQRLVEVFGTFFSWEIFYVIVQTLTKLTWKGLTTFPKCWAQTIRHFCLVQKFFKNISYSISWFCRAFYKPVIPTSYYFLCLHFINSTFFQVTLVSYHNQWNRVSFRLNYLVPQDQDLDEMF